MKHKFLLSLLFLLQVNFAYAKILVTYTITSNPACSTDNSLIVIPGSDIPKLSGTEIQKISLHSLLDNKKQNIVFQIDQKDSLGRYILGGNASNNSKKVALFGMHDELVFRKKNLGKRLTFSSNPLIEIEVIIDQNNSLWIYIDLNSSHFSETNNDFNQKSYSLTYNAEKDTVISPVYKIGFSKEKPFLLNSFHWKQTDLLTKDASLLANQSQWSSDVTDTMKIRHMGKFFGFPFKRTDDDYTSRLVKVKEGSLRIIRRTENKVKVFWKLKSPALYIDYVMMPDGFVMDSMIDIPFKISLFFSELITLTTMDWNNELEQSSMLIESKYSALKIPVNGFSSEDKIAFNQTSGTEFSVASKQGAFNVKLDIPNDFPIHSQLYLKDAQDESDLPENYFGQFGNVGFKTSNWENIDSKLHHLKFTVCVDKN